MNKLTLVCIQMFVLTGVLEGIMISSCSLNFDYVSVYINSIKDKLVNNKINQ